MALTPEQRALYSRLRHSGAMRFHGNEEANEALFEEALDVFGAAGRALDIASEAVARFTFKRNRTVAEAAVGTAFGESDGIWTIPAAGTAAGFVHGLKVGNDPDLAKLRLPERPEHIFGFIVAGGVRSVYQPGGLFVPWGGNIETGAGSAAFVAPFNNSQRVFPHLELDLHPQEIHVYGGGVALTSAAAVQAKATVRWGGTQKGFTITLPAALDGVDSSDAAGNDWTLRVVAAGALAVDAIGAAKNLRVNYPAPETAGDVKTALETAGLTVAYVDGGADADAFTNPTPFSTPFSGGFDIGYPYFDLFLAR